MYRCIKLLISAVLFIYSSSLLCSGKPLILDNADSLIGNMTEGSNKRTFIGNVKFRQGNVNTLCDTAVWNIANNTIDLMGNVVITQESLTLTGPRMYYNGNTSVAEAKNGVTINDKGTFIAADRGFYYTINREVNFFGNVIVDDDSVVIQAEHINHFRNNQNSFAFGDVSIQGKENNTILFGDTVISIPQLDYSMATGKPVLIQIDTNYIIKETNEKFKNPFFTLDTLFISCDTIKSFRNDVSEVYRFIDSVKMMKEDMAAKANYAVFDKNNEKINLDDSPVIWFENTQLFGDSLRIELSDNKLKKITSINNSFVVSLGDTAYPERLNQISGELLEIIFKNDDIESIVSDGDVKSLYFLFSDGYPDGADLAAADRVEIIFENGEAIDMLKISGVSGEVYTEKEVSVDLRKFYLPGFTQRNDKPLRKNFIINGND
jgi:lipopolysaccharide export system protein LptA